MRLQDRRQRTAARQAQGGPPPRLARGACLSGIAVLAAAACAAALAGCGGGSPAYTEANGRPIAPEPQDVEPNKGTPGNQDATGGKVDIAMRGRRFVPAVMHLTVSQIVVFTDGDDVPHTVRNATGRGLPHSGLIPPRGRFEFTPLTPGVVRYLCIVHHGMRGVLIVRPRATAARPRKPSCSRLLRTARHELGDPTGEVETHCTRR